MKIFRIITLLSFIGTTAVFYFAQTKPKKTDIILLTVDTLRADHLGSYGYEKALTPNIDRLAKRGTLFTRASTPIPRTTPALASMLSGLSPNHHGSREVNQAIHDVTLLSEYLKKQGYSTLAISSTHVAGPEVNFDRGFDRFVIQLSRGGRKVTDKAVEEINAMPSDKPKFIWIHYRDPHTPYSPPPSWRDHVKDGRCMELLERYESGELTIGLVFRNYNNLSEAALPSCKQLYDAEIAYQDHQIGRLWSGIKDTVDLDKALIVFTSDHGENLSEDGLYFEHGPSLHQASLSIPLIIAGPGVRHSIDENLIRLQDLAPTIIGFLDLPRSDWPTKVDGFDFSARLGHWNWLLGRKPLAYTISESATALSVLNIAFLNSGTRDERNCLNHNGFSLCAKPNDEPKLFLSQEDPFLRIDVSNRFPKIKEQLVRARKVWPAEEARDYAVLSKRFKLVVRPILEGGYQSALYDLLEDPEEKLDVKARHPDIVDEMRVELDAWLANRQDHVAAERSQDQLKALRSLGYIQ